MQLFLQYSCHQLARAYSHKLELIDDSCTAEIVVTLNMQLFLQYSCHQLARACERSIMNNIIVSCVHRGSCLSATLVATPLPVQSTD